MAAQTSTTQTSNAPQIALLTGIFLIGIGVLSVVYLTMPELSHAEQASLKLPRHIEDAKDLGRLLSRYKDRYFYTVLCGVTCVYIFLQSFAIPGSIFLSILSGFLFPFPVALMLVCTCSAVGATICYLLSFLVGRKLVLRYFPDRVTQWSAQVSRHSEHLFNYILFLRITPFLPNWFINIASPVIDVPLASFFWGTFFGVAPPSVLFIQAGGTLYTLTDTGSAFSPYSILLLTIAALLSLLPVIFRKRVQASID